MAGCIMLRKLKKVALGVVIVLAAWSAVAAQQTSPSQQTKPPEAEETVGLHMQSGIKCKRLIIYEKSNKRR